jgi:5'-deoxynucleotidase YfbR-like HD superfamily hydrolase
MTNQEQEYMPTFGEEVWASKLSKIKRYSPEGGKNPKMVHEQDDFIHSRRVAYLGELISIILKQSFSTLYNPDPKKVFDMGRHHDDPEIITGDILATEKARMSTEELRKLREKEDLASRAIAHLIFGFKPPQDKRYIDNQKEIRDKITLESQIVDVADKWDSLCEILHETRCGNKPFSKLLSFRQDVFVKFKESYPFYKAIESNSLLEFNKIPTPQQANELPTIDINDLKKPADVTEIMSLAKTHELPSCYRTWAALNKTVFDVRPEKFIFPGWCMQLWTKWNIFPGETTSSGLWIR